MPGTFKCPEFYSKSIRASREAIIDHNPKTNTLGEIWTTDSCMDLSLEFLRMVTGFSDTLIVRFR